MDPSIALWGGVECTVNRLGSAYHDQLERNGHAARPQDLGRIAALGIRTLRYPVLWERIAPHGLTSADWSWPDQRLAQMRRLGIEPIVGLLHHGSGPHNTDLLDKDFAPKFAAFAEAVAHRYP
ncbi:MAG: dTDP-4-dehydrorhamnose reductase, partial [Candidatus Eremiobacteraeota bacterium]|nr:dTDP-4-dehydrorhamnose reductase [Candidatus Eremiobacteraeota bacterium]